MNEDIVKSIDELLSSNIGDKGRLEHIKFSILKNKTLYNSDKKYLASLLNTSKKPTCEEPKHSKPKSETPINLDKLRKSQPKPNYESKPIKYGVSFSNSGSGSAKIHMVRCRHVQRSSQQGDVKWSYFSDYNSAKHFAHAKASSQSYGWKYAECCLNGHINRITSGAVILSLFLGIIGSTIGWYITKDYYPIGSKVIFSIGTVITILWLISTGVSYLR